MPDWSFTLNLPGLQFDEGEEPVKIESWEASGLVSWKRRGSIADCGPQDRAYELDVAKDEVRFATASTERFRRRIPRFLSTMQCATEMRAMSRAIGNGGSPGSRALSARILIRGRRGGGFRRG